MTDQDFDQDFDQDLFGDDPIPDATTTPTLASDGMTTIDAWNDLFGGPVDRLDLGAQERARRAATPDPIAAAIEAGTGGLALVDRFGLAELEIYARSTGVLERPFEEMNQRERTLSLVLDLAAAREGRKTRSTVAQEAQEAQETESVFDDLDADEFTALVAGVKAGSLAALPRATRKAMKPFLSGR